MFYPEEVLEEVRTRSDIVDIISGYVRLQKKREQPVRAVPVSPREIAFLFGFPVKADVLLLWLRRQAEM